MNSTTMTGGTMGAMRMGLAVALLAVASAGAQPAAEQRSVARLKSVTGNVLVSRETGLAAGEQAERLTNGTRVITTANSEAVVEFDNGCEVRMKENERFDVDSTRACALLLAQAIGAPVAAAVGPTILTFVIPVIVTLPVLVVDSPETPAVSPN